jgi:hypothetical protein
LSVLQQGKREGLASRLLFLILGAQGLIEHVADGLLQPLRIVVLQRRCLLCSATAEIKVVSSGQGEQPA